MLNTVRLELGSLNIPLKDLKGKFSGQVATAFRKNMTGDDYLELTKNVSTDGESATYFNYEATILEIFYDQTRDSYKTVKREYDRLVQSDHESVSECWRRLSNAKDELKIALDRDDSIAQRTKDVHSQNNEVEFRQKFIDALEDGSLIESLSTGNKGFLSWVTDSKGVDSNWVKYIQATLSARKEKKGRAQAHVMQETDEKMFQPQINTMTAMMQDCTNETHKLAQETRKNVTTLGKLFKEGMDGVKMVVEDSAASTNAQARVLEKKCDLHTEGVEDVLTLMLATEQRSNQSYRAAQGRTNPPPGSKYDSLSRDFRDRSRSPLDNRSRNFRDRSRSPSPHRNRLHERPPRRDRSLSPMRPRRKIVATLNIPSEGPERTSHPKPFPPFDFESQKAFRAMSTNDTPEFKISSVPTPILACWTCGSDDHFMDEPCPLASNMEVLVYLRNKMYRQYKHLPFEEFKDMFTKMVKNSGLKVTREEAKKLFDFYHKFNQNLPRAKNLGIRNNQFCIYCYGTGHASRDCAKFCPYCLNNGHHWRNCNHPDHTDKITKRIASLNKHSLSQAFLAAYDGYEVQCMCFCEEYEKPEESY